MRLLGLPSVFVGGCITLSAMYGAGQVSMTSLGEPSTTHKLDTQRNKRTVKEQADCET